MKRLALCASLVLAACSNAPKNDFGGNAGAAGHAKTPASGDAVDPKKPVETKGGATNISTAVPGGGTSALPGSDEGMDHDALPGDVPAAACDGLLDPSGPQVDGNGVDKTESRPAGSFDGVALCGVGDIVVEAGKAAKVSLTANENVLPVLSTGIAKGSLELGVKPGQNFYNRGEVILNVDMPKVRRLYNYGAGNFEVHAVAGEALDIIMAGAGVLTVTGTVTTLTVHVVGAGQLLADKLIAKNVVVDPQHGAAQLQVNATDKLDIQGDNPAVMVTNKGAAKSAKTQGGIPGIPGGVPGMGDDGFPALGMPSEAP